jgi:hypothetical protein
MALNDLNSALALRTLNSPHSLKARVHVCARGTLNDFRSIVQLFITLLRRTQVHPVPQRELFAHGNTIHCERVEREWNESEMRVERE